MPWQYQAKREVTKVTKWVNGHIFATKKVCEIWVETGLTVQQEKEIAKQNGGDFLTVCTQSRPYDELYRSIKVDT